MKKQLKALAICMTLVLGTSSAVNVYAEGDATASPDTGTKEQGNEPPTGSAPAGGAPGGEAPTGGMPQGGQGGGANTMTYDYTGTLSGALTADGEEVTSDAETSTASEADQNAALVQNGGTLKITNGTLEKSGDDTNGDNCNFYGINSILLSVNDGSFAYIANSKLNASSEGSNAMFATDGGTVYANSDTITTSAGNSRGLDATYGGTIVANDMTISTQGDHSASAATDRGGGSISLTNSTLNTAGSGSPLLYSTGDIEVSNVTGTSSGSQIAGMEGLNTILIYSSELTSTNTEKTASDPMADGIIIYQSTSGDAESTTGETASFEASNSTLKSAIKSGAMFYFTNTSANVVLSDTVLDFDSDNALLMAVQGNDSNNWGTAGSNGAEVSFTALNETLNGNIDVDTISSLNLYLLEGSVYTGSTSISENAVNTNVTEAPIAVNVSADSKWVVTADSTVSNLNAEEGAQIVDSEGKTVTIAANCETVVDGDSDITVTVNGTYSTAIVTDDSNALSSDFIDRTAFDAFYGTSTSFASNSTDAEPTAEPSASASAETSEVGTKSQNTDAALIAVAVVAAVIIAIVIKKKKD